MANDTSAPKAVENIKVFISYSRKDKAFARQLVTALEARGIAAQIDERDLPTLEDWRRELLHFIRECDTVVFIVSHNSITSPVCAWEIQQVVDLQKRLAPVVLERVSNDQIPEAVTRINYLYFDAPNDFETQADRLAKALLIDAAWLREHTRLSILADRWQKSGLPKSQLLRSEEIDRASRFAAARPRNAPPVPGILLQFLEEGRKHEQEMHDRQRRTVGRGFVKPALEALADGQADRALRLAAAGAVLAQDIDFDPKLRTELANPSSRAMLANRTRAVLNGHTSLVNAVAISPDGSTIVTGSSDATARLWRLATGAAIAVLEGHDDAISSAAFSADSSRIVTASSDKSVRVWDAVRGVELARLTGHDGAVLTASFSPDGSRIVTASSDKTVRLWDAAHGNEVARLHGHTDAVLTASFSPDGAWIVSASSDKTARVWDAVRGELVAVLRGHRDTVSCAVFSSNAVSVVTGSHDGTARVWDARSGKEMLRLEGHQDAILEVALRPDGSLILTASSDTTARLWETASGYEVARLSGHHRKVRSAAFSPDGSRIVTASHDGSARLWDAATGKEIAHLQGHHRKVRRAVFSSNGFDVVTASHDSTARVWDARSSYEIGRLEGHEGSIWSAAFSSDSSRIVTASSDTTARVWDAASGREIGRLEGHGRGVTSASFSPDGTRIVTTSRDSLALVWDATGKQVARFRGHSEDVHHAAFSADGSRIVTASSDATARVWDAVSDGQLAVLSGHVGSVNSAAFSGDDCWIVTASSDMSVRVWDAKCGKQIAVLNGHEQPVNCAAFSPDGSRIVTASWDKTARLWDVASGTELVCLRGHTDTVWCAAFSPDCYRIVTASSDTTTRVWDLWGHQLLMLEGHGRHVNGVSFSPDGCRIVTASKDRTARLWDISRTIVIAKLGPSIAITAGLAHGIGRRTSFEAGDLLMQEAPDDLFREARRQLLDPQKHMPVEIAARERQLEETIAALNAPLHPNCYLSPTQFAEKFGLKRPPATRDPVVAGAPNSDQPYASANPVKQPDLALSPDRAEVTAPCAATRVNCPAIVDSSAPVMPPAQQAGHIPPSHLRKKLEAHAKESPILSLWLVDPATVALLGDFNRAEAQAQRRQKRYVATARRAAIFSTLASVIAALVLLPLDEAVGIRRPEWVGLVQFFFVLIAFGAVLRISWSRLLDRRMTSRAEAESLRAEIFRRLMRAVLPGNDGKPALGAQLAAFEDCHLVYQCNYYAKRSKELARAASVVSPLRLLAYAVVAVSCAISALVGLRLASDAGLPLPQWMQSIASITVLEPSRWQLGLGALASAMLAFASAWTLINQDDRNALRYTTTLAQLDALRAELLESARAAANADRRSEVLAFTDRVQAILDGEHAAWVASRLPKDPHAGPGPTLGKAV